MEQFETLTALSDANAQTRKRANAQ